MTDRQHLCPKSVTLPDFSLTGTDGATHTVADLVRDHRGLVLFYFPKANTDG